MFDGNGRQVWVQIVEGLVGLFYSFGVSYVIIAAIDCIPGFEVLAAEQDVLIGLDKSQMAESRWEDSWAGEEDYNPFKTTDSLSEREKV